MKKYLKNITHGFAVAATMLCATAAHAESTNACLALLGDSSFSVSGAILKAERDPSSYDMAKVLSKAPAKDLKYGEHEEYAHMVTGMADALRDPRVIEKIIANAPVAISYLEFSSVLLLRIAWQVLKTEKDVLAFADRLDNLPRILSGITSTNRALRATMRYITNECPGIDKLTRKVIDVATDDRPTTEKPEEVEEADRGLRFNRDRAVEAEITINALAMKTRYSRFIKDHGYAAFIKYLDDNVVTKPEGQTFDVKNISYKEAFTRKFSIEIAQGPALHPTQHASIMWQMRPKTLPSAAHPF